MYVCKIRKKEAASLQLKKEQMIKGGVDRAADDSDIIQKFEKVQYYNVCKYIFSEL